MFLLFDFYSCNGLVMLDFALAHVFSACYVLQESSIRTAVPISNLMTFPCVTFLLSNVKLTHSYDRFPLDSEHFLTYRYDGW